MTPSSSTREQRVAEREDLEAAGVGEDRAVPAHERVQAAELGDHVLARAGSAGGTCCRGRSARRARAARRGRRVLTVAFVPTGMNAGVGTSPCAVCSTPARAAPSVAVERRRRSCALEPVVDARGELGVALRVRRQAAARARGCGRAPRRAPRAARGCRAASRCASGAARTRRASPRAPLAAVAPEVAPLVRASRLTGSASHRRTSRSGTAPRSRAR